jgi:hypothetical protein
MQKQFKWVSGVKLPNGRKSPSLRITGNSVSARESCERAQRVQSSGGRPEQRLSAGDDPFSSLSDPAS